MNNYFNRFLSIMLLLVVASSGAQAQVYHGTTAYDGTHKNELSSMIQYGHNIVTGRFGDLDVEYRHHLTSRWSLVGAVDGAVGKSRVGFYTKSGYRLPTKHFNFNFQGKYMYNRYIEASTNEQVLNASLNIEHSYFDITVGESFIWYNTIGEGYREPLTLTFGVAANIRPRDYAWNLGIFARNYDEFYYENWEINWGIHFNARLSERTRLYGELNIRPAGSLSQLASKYETSLKIGAKYVW